jgi:hypothetical protein
MIEAGPEVTFSSISVAVLTFRKENYGSAYKIAYSQKCKNMTRI